MTREEALQRIVDNNFASEYGFDLQILIDCMVVAREIILNSQFPVEDCISRAEAIKAIRNYNVTIEVGRAIGKSQLADIVDSINKVQEKMISELPSIQPQPKTGHWIDHQEGRWIYAQCSECGTVHDTQTNYCPNCGAKMESEG